MMHPEVQTDRHFLPEKTCTPARRSPLEAGVERGDKESSLFADHTTAPTRRRPGGDGGDNGGGDGGSRLGGDGGSGSDGDGRGGGGGRGLGGGSSSGDVRRGEGACGAGDDAGDGMM